MKSLFHATFSWLAAVVVSFKNYKYLRKPWPMPAWIPVEAEACIFGKASLVFWQTVFWNQMGILYQTEISWLRAFLWRMSQTSRDQDNSRRVRTHEKNSGGTVRRLGTIIQSIFCCQSGAGIRLNFWKWSGESRYPGALPPVFENFRPAFSPDLTDCPWVSEDGNLLGIIVSAAKVTVQLP